MEPALRQIIGVHGARMYYNLTSIHSVLRSAPFGDLLAGIVQPVRRARRTTERRPTRLAPAYRVAPGLRARVIAAKTTWQYLFLTSRVRAVRTDGRRLRRRDASRATEAEDRNPSFWTISAASSTSAATAGRTRRSPTRRRWSVTARCSGCWRARSPAATSRHCTTRCSRRCRTW